MRLDLNIDMEAVKEGLHGIEEGAQAIYMHNGNGDIKRSQSRKKSPCHKDRQSVLQNLGSKNGITAIGRHKKHITLFRI